MIRNLFRWSKDEIAMEIRSLYLDGEELNYTSVEKNHLALLRAACRYFGSWKDAVEFAGLDYSKIRKYKTWTKAKIIERIQELHRQEVDLSWRNISTKVDPALAAAAVRANRFGSWRAALEAAGLNYDEIRRYREWDESLVIDEVRELAEAGEPLNSRDVQEHTPPLFHAARRRFENWDSTLEAAGLDADRIRKRPRSRETSASCR
ncbi:MAG TPA: hypothetical protein PLY56_03330 [Armatimonadota bacterium]|jgi:hypothetical protein|nr:hypothetical protein [Armatimonadota bacterium]HOM80888.1 hypothetical protein [Armatimonadota bacterium]HPO72332.1 hypothetical protein [Armatimonadota bacterium]